VGLGSWEGFETQREGNEGRGLVSAAQLARETIGSAKTGAALGRAGARVRAVHAGAQGGVELGSWGCWRCWGGGGQVGDCRDEQSEEREAVRRPWKGKRQNSPRGPPTGQAGSATGEAQLDAQSRHGGEETG
jgi:hypothetical protein